MNFSADQIAKDLGFFADLGTGGVKIAEAPNSIFCELVRNSEPLTLEFPKNSNKPIVETNGNGEERKHPSYRSMLASERFGNLIHWAKVQEAFLHERLEDSANYIEVHGSLDNQSGNYQSLETKHLHKHLVDLANESPDENKVQILLINGPAGIGKTIAIQRLALERAKNYRAEESSLVLHVESRGRLLTFIQDLMAFSLQKLHLNVTFDQAPVLIRNGLILLAIDGFDELGDPSGYDLAWAQVNELVNDVKGGGQVLLAGRETFIGKERIINDIHGLDRKKDVVQTLTLAPPSPANAKNWLKKHGWSDNNIKSFEDLFELGAYSLRPFFLGRLADKEFSKNFRKTEGDSQLTTLVNLMIDREAEKFGEAVDKQWSEETRGRFIKNYMCEVARELAESQSDAIGEDTLQWLVDYVAQRMDEDISADAIRILMNRANVIAFLVEDDRPKFRRFSHSQMMYYFLSHDAIDMIAEEEFPKYIKRNIFASDFLSVFSDVVASRIQEDDSDPKRFRDICMKTLGTYPGTDRVSRNLAAFLLCFLSTKLGSKIEKITTQEINEALIVGSPESTEVKVDLIHHLDIRNSDVSKINFGQSRIINLVVNANSRVPANLRKPQSIEETTLRGGVESLYGKEKIHDWIVHHSPDDSAVDASVTRSHDVFKLLDRACRYPNHWIREKSDDEPMARQIIGHELWPNLLEALRKHDLVTEKGVSARKPASTFFHIKRKWEILRKIRGDHQDNDALMVSDDDGNIDALLRDLDKFATNNS